MSNDVADNSNSVAGDGHSCDPPDRQVSIPWPAEDYVRDASRWILLHRQGPVIGLIRGTYVFSDAGYDPEQPAIVHAAAVDDLTTQGLSGRHLLRYTEKQQDSKQVMHEAVRRVSRSIKASVPKALAAVAGVLHPPVAAGLAIKAAVHTTFDRSVVHVTRGEVSGLQAITVEREIEIAADENRKIFVCPAYRWMQIEIYLAFIDFLVIDYRSGRRVISPSRDQADRSYRNILGLPPKSRARNYVRVSEHVGTFKFLQRTNNDPIFFEGNVPPAVDPSQTLLVPCGREVEGLTMNSTMRNLYEITDNRQQFPKYAAQAREMLRMDEG